jgi:tetratricopeptide (TPR) repeat protein
VKNVLVYLLFTALIFATQLGQPAPAQGLSGGLSQLHYPNSQAPRSDIDLYLELAVEGLEARQYGQVVRLCERILQKDAVNKEAHLLSGMAHHYLGEYDQAIEKLRWVLLLDKDNSLAKEYLARSKREDVLQLNPEEVIVLQYHEDGLGERAIRTLKELLKKVPITPKPTSR